MTMSNPADGRYILSGERLVWLTKLSLTSTYAGQLEGTPATITSHLRKRFAEELAQAETGLVVLDDGQPELPAYRWEASFNSRSGVRHTDSDYSSRLTIRWFSDTIPADLHAVISAVLSRVDWEVSADDYDIMDF
jgi:hypothetical protein